MKDLSFIKQTLIAHRGLHNNKIQENTIEAFKKAILKKQIIELDIHLIKDNTIVVFHDDNLERIYGIDKKINRALLQTARQAERGSALFCYR